MPSVLPPNGNASPLSREHSKPPRHRRGRRLISIGLLPFLLIVNACAEPAAETTPTLEAEATTVSTTTTTSAPTTTKAPTTSAPTTTRRRVRSTSTTRRSSAGTSSQRNCDPSYPDTCLHVGAGDYDCSGGSGNGPNYVDGPIQVKAPDPFDLDRDGDGVGCESG